MDPRRLALPKTSFFLFGPRATGKTTWRRQVLPDAEWFDLVTNENYLKYLHDPDSFRRAVEALPAGTCVAVDEVQKVPALLDEVQALIASHGRRHRFALSGSSTRKLRRLDANMLAGRVINRSFFRRFRSTAAGRLQQGGPAIASGYRFARFRAARAHPRAPAARKVLPGLRALAIFRRGRIGQGPATATVTIRIGGVPYGVGAPLLAGLDSDPAATLVQAPPTRLIEQLRAGQLDAALVSSVEAVRQPGYTVAAGLGIACKQEIRSVRAFRRRGVPIRSVALDESSATSVALLRILLAKRFAGELAGAVSFTPIAPTRTPDALPHDLVLLIGDHGLAAAPGDREVWDMGRQWTTWTGLPFVFALWLMRPGADAARVVPVLHAARARGRALGPVDGTHGAAHYDLDADDVRGLLRFWAEARELGLATAPDPRFVSPTIPAPR